MSNCQLAKSLKLKAQSGQVLLIVLLGMAIVLTLVLSIVARSVTDVSITKKDEESLRAFSAAEAGVEKVLLTGSGESGSFEESQSRYTAEVSAIGNSQYYYLPDKYKSGEVATVWFVEHNNQGKLTCDGGTCVNPVAGNGLKICWGEAGTPRENSPAIEVSFYYDTTLQSIAPSANYSGIKVKRATFDPYDIRQNDNNFGTGYTTTCNWQAEVGTTFPFTSGVNETAFFSLGINCGPGCLLFARIKMLYQNTDHGIAVKLTNGTFPEQGTRVTSTGTSGEATRKVEAIQTFSAPLDIFENAIFSNSGDLYKP